MFQKLLSLALVGIITGMAATALADVQKIAVVDVQAVVSKSAQVKALRKEREAKSQELVKFINNAGADIKKQTDPKKKEELAKKYEKELNAKKEANAKAYKTKLQAIDKSISDTITSQAKAMGYDMVLTKGVVLYGGDDITEAVSKVVK